MKRPDGNSQIVGAWVLLILGVLLLLMGANMHVDTYPSIDTSDLMAKWLVMYVGSGSVGLAVLLFMTGWIIRAISFLPGRDDAILTTPQPTSGLHRLVDETGLASSTTDNKWLAWVVLGVIAMLGLFFASGEIHRNNAQTFSVNETAAPQNEAE